MNGRYRIAELLGKGNQGEVYRAIDTKLNREVAIKLLRPGNLSRQELRVSLEREAIVMASIDHRNIVGVYDYGVTGETERPFLVMQYVSGKCLDAFTEPLRDDEIFALIQQVGSALQCAHDSGVVHRDLKPGNLMFLNRESLDPQFMVLDLGIAKLTGDDRGFGSIRDMTYAGYGTPFYMAPEQIVGSQIDCRVDIYSLGVILYELIAGESPFAQYSHSLTKLLQAVTTLAARPLDEVAMRDVPPELNRLITQCLSKRPDQRPASMAEVVARAKAAMNPATRALPVPPSGSSLSATSNFLAESPAKTLDLKDSKDLALLVEHPASETDDSARHQTPAIPRRQRSWRLAQSGLAAKDSSGRALVCTALTVAIATLSIFGSVLAHRPKEESHTSTSESKQNVRMPAPQLPPQTQRAKLSSMATIKIPVQRIDSGNDWALQPILPGAEPILFELDGEIPDGLNVDEANGELSWTPEEKHESETFDVTLVAIHGDNTQQRVDLTLLVESPPQKPLPEKKREERPITLAPLRVATDEGEEFTCRLQSQLPSDFPDAVRFKPSSSLPPDAMLDAESGEFRWTPTEQDGPGEFRFDFKIVAETQVATASILLEVREVNQPPTIKPVPAIEVAEGELVEVDFQVEDADFPRSELLTRLVSTAISSVKFNDDSFSFSWTPGEEDGPGSHSVTFYVSDGMSISEQTVSISVKETHRPPNLHPVPDQRGQVGERLSFRVIATNDDVPPAPVKLALKNEPEGMVIDSESGRVTWVPGYEHSNTSHEFTILAKSHSETIVSTPVLVQVADTEGLINSLGMEMRLIPPGEFTMGSPRHEAMRDEQEKPHQVAITEALLIASHETTKAQFAAFVQATQYLTTAEQSDEGGTGFDLSRREWRKHPDYSWRNPGFAQGDNHPVVNVSWTDADRFCKWLSHEEGYTYRLPTEAEWEYACRAGSASRYSFGNELSTIVRHANVRDASAVNALNPGEARSGLSLLYDGYPFTSPSRSFRPNRFGLFDMHGNVAEWCSDWMQESYYSYSPRTDPVGPVSGNSHVVRGGAWSCSEPCLRSAARRDSDFDEGSINYGFRIVREI